MSLLDNVHGSNDAKIIEVLKFQNSDLLVKESARGKSKNKSMFNWLLCKHAKNSGTFQLEPLNF